MNCADDKPSDAATWPRAGSSFALFRGDSVLLVHRSKPPRLWSLPGGHIEPGETAAAAAARELLEETGIAARTEVLVDVLDMIIHDADRKLRAHYLVTVYAGRWRDGEPHAASDVSDARFVPLAALDEYQLTPGAKRIIAQARARI